jgi:hypothetical protein
MRLTKREINQYGNFIAVPELVEGKEMGFPYLFIYKRRFAQRWDMKRYATRNSLPFDKLRDLNENQE